MNSGSGSTDPYFRLTDSWLATSPEVAIHFHDLGEGAPVVFLHGSGIGVSAAANWWMNLPAIAEHHRVLALDLLGFGLTQSAPTVEFGVRAWVDQVIRFADRLGLSRFWLVGNSLGGWVALQLACDHPGRVAGIVSMGTGGGARAPVKRADSEQLSITTDDMRRMLGAFVSDPAFVTDELIEIRLRAANRDGVHEQYQRVLAARERDRAESPIGHADLERLDVPVLLIHGREDKVIPLRRSLDLLDALPAADLHVYSRCGHWSQIERADDFNEAVIRYISSHEG